MAWIGGAAAVVLLALAAGLVSYTGFVDFKTMSIKTMSIETAKKHAVKSLNDATSREDFVLWYFGVDCMVEKNIRVTGRSDSDKYFNQHHISKEIGAYVGQVYPEKYDRVMHEKFSPSEKAAIDRVEKLYGYKQGVACKLLDDLRAVNR